MAAKAHTALDENDNQGRFVRTEAGFRNWIEDGGEFAPEAGRYILYISYACPWANRCLAVRNLKGLQDTIALSVVHPTWARTRPDNPEDAHTGWQFRAPDDPPVSSSTGMGSFGCEGCIPDPCNGARFVRDLYELSQDTTGKYSVPVLWDKKTGRIVNNESSEIIKMLNSRFNGFATNPELDLDPADLQDAQAEVDAWIYPNINNGVYRSGFAKTQLAYDEAVTDLGNALDRLEALLGTQRYVAGDRLTLSDIRLFMTLVRYDEVYVVYFKTNLGFLASEKYPNIRQYCREMYQLPGMPDAINMDHIKTHYFTSHPIWNHFAIVPRGPGALTDMAQPHNRAEVFPAGASA